MRPELHDQRREKILRAAHLAFLRMGFTRTRIEDVARAARVANATVYTYFETKERLFEAVVAQALAAYEGLFDAVERTAGDDVGRTLTAYGRVYFRFMADPTVRGVYRTVSAETAHKPQLGMMLYHSAHRLLGGVLQRLLRRYADEDRLAIADIAVAARMFEGMIEHVTLTISMLQGDEAPPLHPSETYVPEVVRIFMAAHQTSVTRRS
ncbi:TetR family transcriptional regulator [Caulobacter sp. SLTY]|uniref:TetR/AcrR family transcriptional regulator C-terminal domain-containing protein n=1 Tax=Caulobacter sp. SLTY TaxID=2683262 RepID=UPI00141338D7|nr:TetR/AcrR family transcriptional regulator C-terminal domain-containing protein [Caulobacter sp. SLTY]NBB15114.1 TetR family transcriptional regulator [Caulobacter sp. SLTY]